MGIDIYATWRKQTKKEKEKQFCGYGIDNGHNGYLREAYHGEPYATRFFVKEAFDAKDGEALISYKVLQKRLPATRLLAIKRAKEVYNESVGEAAPEVMAFVNFVKLCKEKELATGEPCLIRASY